MFWELIRPPPTILGKIPKDPRNFFPSAYLCEFGAKFTIGFWPPATSPPQEVDSCPKVESHYRPYMCYIFGKPWVQGPLWHCSRV